jgi:GcrA cell cycle regulator
MSWTDERVELLKTMWSEGKSASQIAKALGGVTRNAVIGKVHRLGLSNRTAASPRPAESAEPAEEAPAAAAAAAPAEAEAPAAPSPAAAAPRPEPEAPAPREPAIREGALEADLAAEAAPPAARPQAPAPQPPAPVSEVSEEARRNLELVERKAKKLSLLQLTERTCKWPIGDPATDDFYFCGLPAAPGKPYCDAHVAVAFQPMSARRDRARAR